MKWSLTITGDESEVRDLERIARMLREPVVIEELEGKYSPLQAFLIQKREAGESKIDLTLAEVQRIIQTELPPSAHKHDSFWRDRRRNVGAHIVRAGWHIEAIGRNQESNRIEKIELHTCTKKCKGSDKHDH